MRVDQVGVDGVRNQRLIRVPDTTGHEHRSCLVEDLGVYYAVVRSLTKVNPGSEGLAGGDGD